MFAKLWNLLFGKRKESLGEPNAAETTPAGTAPAALDGSPVATASDAEASIEELCELRDGMTHEEMRAHLALLYRRHNRAASSLDPERRAHAERMLDAIVEARHRYLEKDPY